MKTMEPIPVGASVREQAQHWLLRLMSGHATADDADAFRRWRQADPLHARAFSEVRQLWQALEPAHSLAVAAERERSQQLVPDRTALPRGPGRSSSAIPPRGRAVRMGRRAFLSGAVAATAGWMVVRSPLGLWPNWQEMSADYRTATGERREFVLSGMTIAMGTRTALSGQPGDGSGARGVEVVEGEAQFEVPAAATAAISIRVAAATVDPAPGSRINVRCVGEDVRVTCLQGEARVSQGGRHVVLQPAWQARLAPHRIASVAQVDAERIDGWRRGLLIFNNEPLADVVDEINRHRSGRIVVASSELGRRLVQARIPLDRLDTFVDLVRDAYGAKILPMPGGVVLMG
jgi:transmembrane sensor